jgi:hypothetical protein
VRVRIGEHMTRAGENRRAQFVLMGKPYRKRPLERRKYGGENSIKRDLEETCCEWILRAEGGVSSGL